MKSSSQHVFAQLPKVQIPRSAFKRNMTWKTAFDSGYLVPIYVDEALPGDTYNVKVQQFARLSSPLSLPVMDNIYLDTFFFAVPIRLLWENFERMCGARDNPDDHNDFLAPIIDWKSGSCTEQSLSDYLSIPLGYKGVCTSLWHRAYNLIWNEWFRDGNLQDSVAVPTGDGPDDIGLFTLLRRGKRHDYFTSSLPWVQRGPSSSIGLSGYAPVSSFDGESYRSFALSQDFSKDTVYYLLRSSSAPFGLAASHPGLGSSGLLAPGSSPGEAPSNSNPPQGKTFGVPTGSLFADLSSTSATTINSLREAFAIQRQLERDARAGSNRFTEILLTNFGVTSPDARLQRPEYLGGGSYPLQVHTVAQTSATESGSLTPQGNLAAYGLGGGGCGFVKSFVEHSVIIGLACARCDLTYQQGLHRMFSRRARFDWYWPALHNLGEQAVLNKEIYADNSAEDDKAFGYQERWAEYRYGQSRITGKLRSTAAQPLDSWHLAQDFATRPALNADFISEHPPLDRVLAVVDEPQIVYDSLIVCNCVRPMGTYSIPGLVDHM